MTTIPASWLVLKHLESRFLNPHINPKLTRKSSKVAWCHVMAHICRGKDIANLGQALLQTPYKPELLSKMLRGSDREMCSPCGRNVIPASFRLVFSSTGNMERQDIHAEI